MNKVKYLEREIELLEKILELEREIQTLKNNQRVYYPYYEPYTVPATPYVTPNTTPITTPYTPYTITWSCKDGCNSHSEIDNNATISSSSYVGVSSFIDRNLNELKGTLQLLNNGYEN